MSDDNKPCQHYHIAFNIHDCLDKVQDKHGFSDEERSEVLSIMAKKGFTPDVNWSHQLMNFHIRYLEKEDQTPFLEKLWERFGTDDEHLEVTWDFSLQKEGEYARPLRVWAWDHLWCRNYMQHKYDFKERGFLGFGPNKTDEEDTPYRDFWRWTLKKSKGEISNGGWFTMKESWAEEVEGDLQEEFDGLLDLFKKMKDSKVPITKEEMFEDYDPDPQWKKDILQKYMDEFGKGDVGQREIFFHVSW
ncbi:MAG: hypothetical protein AAGM67_00265 [Bacteroidota bacterium]